MIKFAKLTFLGATLLVFSGGCVHRTKNAKNPRATFKQMVESERDEEPFVNFEGDRLPSSALQSPFEPGDLQLFYDYFHVDTRGKKVKFRVVPEVNTTIGNEFMRDRVLAAVQQAFLEAFNPDQSTSPEKQDSEVGFLGSVKKPLVSNLVDQFIKTAEVHRLVDSTIQIDLYFQPEKDDPSSLDSELSSNQLTRLDTTGSLLSQFRDYQHSSPFQKIASSAPYFASFPSEKNYRYFGGVISIWVKILNTNEWYKVWKWRPSNGVQGYVRYRRYFVMRGNDQGKLVSSDKEYGNAEYQLNPKPSLESPSVLTVDLYKKFNLNQKDPKPQSLEVTFGQLLPVSSGREGFLSSRNSEKPVQTGGKLLLQGSSSRGKSFSKPVSKVSVDFESGQTVTMGDSDLQKAYAGDFIKKFQFERFYSVIGGAKQ